MIKRKELIDTFEARSTDSKTSYIIHIYQNILNASSFGNPSAEKSGLKEAVTYPDMVPCNRIDDNTFQILNGEIVTKILK